MKHDEQQLTLLVHRMTWEAEGVLSLVLRHPAGEALPPWQPGAHLDLHLPGVITRQYSLCGDPDDSTAWTIAVLREPAGKGGSEAVHDRVRPGQLVDVVGSRNHFEFATSPRYLFIAGGIGITPILPMVQRAEEAGADWALWYGGRTRPGMAFADRFDRYGSRAILWPQDERGLLDLSTLKIPAADTLVYCCGPEPLLAAVQDACGDWPSESVRFERFKPRDQGSHDAGVEAAFTAVLQRSGCEVRVAPGQSVLDAVEAAGFAPDSSCREGICGTCETTVLAGVPDHRDSLLSETERAENTTMMICVGRALSERLVLDL